MPENEKPKLPELPEEAPHIFTGVLFQLLSEVDYHDLVYLSQLLKINKREEIYVPLTDALRKIQWAKLASIEAVAREKGIEKDIEQVEEGVIAFNPVGQTQHAKAVFEFVIHTKAALDSIAVFLTELLSIPVKRDSERDFKHKKFCEQVMRKDAVIGHNTRCLEQWFLGVQDRRDKWIHRTSTIIFIAMPPGEIGLLPIPKIVTEALKLQDFPPTKEYYWTTQEFVELNLAKLASFFSSIVTRCIEIESVSIGTPPPYPQKSEYPPIAFFPFRVTKDMKLKGIRLRF